MIKRIVIAVVLLVVALNWTWGRLPAEPPLPAGSHFAVVDGVKIHYVETAGKGPGVVMVHGHPGTHLDWQRVQAQLPGVRTVAIDRPGYGFSGGGYLPFERQVKIVHELAVKLGMRDAVIAGHSYGGAIALAYADRYSEFKPHVVAVDPAFDTEVLDGFARLQARMIKLLGLPVVRPLANATFSQLFFSAAAVPQVKQAFAPDAVVDAYRDQLRAVSLKPSDLRTFADETLSFKSDVGPSAARFTQITTPTWILQGRGDKLVPAASVVRGAEQIRSAKLTLLPGGHMQPWVRPQAVAGAVRKALR